MRRILPQQCPVAALYVAWLVYLGGVAYFVVRGDPASAGAWAVLYLLALWGYVKAFPRISRWLGYGRVDDEAAEGAPGGSARVTLYTALACPFCPIVEERLRELQEAMGFELRRIDVTLKPELLKRKGIRSVPVVEVGERRITGHATSRELEALVRGRAPAAVAGGEDTT